MSPTEARERKRESVHFVIFIKSKREKEEREREKALRKKLKVSLSFQRNIQRISRKSSRIKVRNSLLSLL